MDYHAHEPAHTENTMPELSINILKTLEILCWIVGFAFTYSKQCTLRRKASMSDQVLKIIRFWGCVSYHPFLWPVVLLQRHYFFPR